MIKQFDHFREDCFKSIQCLFLATEEDIANDINKKVKEYIFILEKHIEELEKQLKQRKLK